MPKTSHFLINFQWSFHVFSRPSPGHHFSWLLSDLVPISSILGLPWHPTGPKIAHEIAQVAPIMFKKIDTGPPWDRSWKRPASKIVFGVLLGTILVFGIPLAPKWEIFAWFVNQLMPFPSLLQCNSFATLCCRNDEDWGNAKNRQELTKTKS